jgi:ABC-2 type transport system permease protein
MGTEFMTVFWRDMIKFWRLKAMLFAALIQPVLWLALFGIGMSDSFAKNVPSFPVPAGALEVDYLTFIAAGIISMTVLFTCLYSGVFLQLDRQFGLLKQIVVSPMERSHILFGLTISGTVKSLIQVIIIVAFGLVLGVEMFKGFSAGDAVVAFLGILGFTVLFATGLMFLSSAISLKIESHEGVQAVITMLTLPLFFASNALYPIESLPWALKGVSLLNPLTYYIDGVRYFGIGDDFYSFGTHYEFTDNDVLMALAALVVFNILAYILAAVTVKNAKVV